MKVDAPTLAAALKAEARRIGFDLVGIAPAVAPAGVSHLHDWLAAGHAGAMDYIDRRREAYADPGRVLRDVRSIVMVAINYRTDDPQPLPPGAGRVSRYAWSDADYHDVLKERLRSLADFLHERAPGCRTRGVVDSAPLLERDFARLSGLGWFGKNTMLLNKRLGSWFFLSGLLTDVELPPDAPHATSHCGTCTRCLDACPTDAFVEPYVLDARRCISYLTIELRDRPIPEDLRPGLGEWAFGCDVCQDVCPWNGKAPVSTEPAFARVEGRDRLRLEDLVPMDDGEFTARYGDTPLSRPGRESLLRNACLAAANTGGASELSWLRAAQGDSSPLVRETARWAEAHLQQRLGEAAGDAGCSESPG